MRIQNNISADDFYEMRKSVHWNKIKPHQLQTALNNSMAVVGIYEEDKIVAMGRIVGDGSCKAMLTDIIVKPEYQKRGYGKKVVEELIKGVKEKQQKNTDICIEGSPTKGNRNFYIRCGFTYNPEEQDGIYLWITK